MRDLPVCRAVYSLGFSLPRRVHQDTRGNCIIPQNRIFAYNKFVRRIFTPCLAVKHKESDMRRMFGFMIGIVVGALIGSTVSLLLAPETGEKLRSELRARGEILVNDVRNAAEARRIEMTEQLESMRAPRTS